MDISTNENYVEIGYSEKEENYINNISTEGRSIGCEVYRRICQEFCRTIGVNLDSFLIKTNENDIKCINNLKEFNSNVENNEILCRIRKSFKTNKYEAIKPILKSRPTKHFYNDLDNKIWFPIKSPIYHQKGNNKNYCLNNNDIIKLGQNKYIVHKKPFSLDKEKLSINNDDNSNNNISYISSINKKAKSIFNIDIKENQYIINNNKNKGKENEVNRQKIKCSNETKNEISIESKNESITEGENKYKIINVSYSRNEIFSRSESRVITENENKNEIIYESECKNETFSRSENRPNTENYFFENEHENGNENENNKCRICFNSNSDINNPLICLCNCHDFIHYECLKLYLKPKISVSENLKKTVTTYRCQKFNCHICLKPYLLKFRIPEFDKTYELIDLALPEATDYICLESLDYIKDNNNIKTVHIIKLQDQEIAIVKNNNIDIFDKDVSNTKVQAVLKYNKSNGNLYLENKSAKFDTLVLVRGNIEISEEKIYFQIGNFYISMELKNVKSFKNYGKEIPNLFLDNAIHDNNDNHN